MTMECITFAETPFSFYDGGVGKHLLAMTLGGALSVTILTLVESGIAHNIWFVFIV